MKLEIESTGNVVQFAGAPCREWRGTTPKGVEVVVLVRVIGVDSKADVSELQSELAEMTPMQAGPRLGVYSSGSSGAVVTDDLSAAMSELTDRYVELLEAALPHVPRAAHDRAKEVAAALGDAIDRVFTVLGADTDDVDDPPSDRLERVAAWSHLECAS